MMAIKQIHKVELGTVVHLSIECNRLVSYETYLPHIEVEVVGIFSGSSEMCVVWNNGTYSGYGLTSLAGWTEDKASYVMHDNFHKYGLYKWIEPRTQAKVIQDIIISPDQVCSSCKLPAPHVKPNFGDVFVCKFCEVINSL